MSQQRPRSAWNGDDTRALFVNLFGLATDAQQAGQPVLRSWDLPHSDVSAHAQAGRYLTSATCVGAFPFPGPQVAASWAAQSGHVDAMVVPSSGASGGMPIGTAYAVLSDLELVDPGGSTLVIPRVVVNGVGVGFYPP